MTQMFAGFNSVIVLFLFVLFPFFALIIIMFVKFNLYMGAEVKMMNHIHALYISISNLTFSCLMREKGCLGFLSGIILFSRGYLFCRNMGALAAFVTHQSDQF